MSNTIAKRSTCSACGTAPINHRFFRISSLLENTLEPVVQFLFGWIPVPHEGVIATFLSNAFFIFFSTIGIVSYNSDPEKASSGRTKLIWDEAIKHGIPMQQIMLLNRPIEQYRAKINGKNWYYFQSIPIPFWLPIKGYIWLDDKFILAAKLRAGGINAPKAAHVWTWRKTVRAFNSMHKPVIIKPRAGSRGRHTTTNINTREELRRAYALGKEIAFMLVVEEHLFGSVYRATVINGDLVGFFRADPPQVTGDGAHTIKELIESKNISRNPLLGEIQINDDLRSFIGRKKYTVDSVLEKGLTIDLSAKTGRFYGGYTKEMFPEIHPGWHTVFKKVGTIAEASIVGFDIIMADPTLSPDSQTWGIIEANTMPFIDLHYFALEGTPIDLSKNIWDLWQQHYTS